MGSNQGSEVLSAESLSLEEGVEHIVGRVWSKTSREETIGRGSGGVSSSHNLEKVGQILVLCDKSAGTYSLDLGATGACKSGMASSKLNKICCSNLAGVGLVEVCEECIVRPESAVLRAIDFVCAQKKRCIGTASSRSVVGELVGVCTFTSTVSFMHEFVSTCYSHLRHGMQSESRLLQDRCIDQCWCPGKKSSMPPRCSSKLLGSCHDESKCLARS